MIHVAVGLLAIALTCLVISIISFVTPALPQVDGLFFVASVVAVAVSSAFVASIIRLRL